MKKFLFTDYCWNNILEIYDLKNTIDLNLKRPSTLYETVLLYEKLGLNKDVSNDVDIIYKEIVNFLENNNNEIYKNIDNNNNRIYKIEVNSLNLVNNIIVELLIEVSKNDNDKSSILGDCYISMKNKKYNSPYININIIVNKSNAKLNIIKDISKELVFKLAHELTHLLQLNKTDSTFDSGNAISANLNDNSYIRNVITTTSYLFSNLERDANIAAMSYLIKNNIDEYSNINRSILLDEINTLTNIKHFEKYINVFKKMLNNKENHTNSFKRQLNILMLNIIDLLNKIKSESYDKKHINKVLSIDDRDPLIFFKKFLNILEDKKQSFIKKIYKQTVSNLINKDEK